MDSTITIGLNLYTDLVETRKALEILCAYIGNEKYPDKDTMYKFLSDYLPERRFREDGDTI